MVQTRIEAFPDIPALIDFFQEVPEYDASMYCHKKMKTNEETSLTVLKEVLPFLEAQEDYTNDPLFASLSEFVKEKGLQERLCNVASSYSCFRQADDTGRRYRDHGDHWQG